MRRHILIGTGAAVLLMAAYLGIIALVQDWGHALEQTGRLWYWVLALAGGFGIQAGLFSYTRHAMRTRRLATGSVAASGTVSAGSMAACCAHHLSDVLPLLGLSGLATFLVDYQLLFIVLGVLSNIIGIIVMLEIIQRHGLSQKLGRLNWSLKRLRNGALLMAPLILLSFLLLYSPT